MSTVDSPPPADTNDNFFSRLFDFSFSTFITTSVIRVLYILLVILAGLGAFAMFLGLAAGGGAGVVLGLVLAPLLFFVYVLFGRVWLEVLIVVFRIAENTEEMARATRGGPRS